MNRKFWVGRSNQFRRIVLPALSPLAVAFSLCLPSGVRAAQPLPTGGQFVAGSGSISSSATSLTVSQTSSRGIVNWTSFSIADGYRVMVDNGTGATLNRVTGGNPSSILGALSATGSIYLINPQGVVVGQSGVVSTGGRFLASTLDVDNGAFMGGGSLVLSGTSGASVVNLGKISSTGGDVFLVAAKQVTNSGMISTPNGTTELAAGQQVLLQDSSMGQQVFVQTGSGGTVQNRGVIEAAQINLQAADGNVFALAGNHARLSATGTATRDGHVWLVADTGAVALGAGTISAKLADGTGGTVDTVAGTLSFGATVPSVLAGVWNVTTPAFTVDTAAASAFSQALSGGASVNLNASGAGGKSGDITIASTVDWTGAASFTLSAYHTMHVGTGATMSNQGSGNLTLRADATGIDNGGSVINGGTIDWSHSTGIVSALYDMNGRFTPGWLTGNSAWTAPLYSGLLTQLTAYRLINSEQDLAAAAAGDASENYALGKDIAGGGTQPLIGGGGTAFTGQFDGMGHAIDGLSGALFDVVGESGAVRNLRLTNDNIPYPASGAYANGLLMNVNKGTVANVGVSGKIWDGPSGNDTPIGGIAGTNYGTIVRAAANVDIETYGVTGGIVGINYGLVDQSYSSGNVGSPLSYQYAGALVGDNRGTISHSYSDAVTGGYTASALVYYNEGLITQSYAAGPDYSGNGAGIAYQNTGTIADDVYWDKDGTNQAHGVAVGTPMPDANGLSSAQMRDPSSFVGWDFSAGGIWAIPAGGGQPVLRWQLEHAPGAL